MKLHPQAVHRRGQEKLSCTGQDTANLFQSIHTIEIYLKVVGYILNFLDY